MSSISLLQGVYLGQSDYEESYCDGGESPITQYLCIMRAGSCSTIHATVYSFLSSSAYKVAHVRSKWSGWVQRPFTSLFTISYTMAVGAVLSCCIIYVLACSHFFPTLALPTVEASIKKRAISQELMDDFMWYIKYASGADQIECLYPNGQTLVTQVSRLRLLLFTENVKII